MAQRFRSLHDGFITLPMDEVKVELQRALPAGHPVVERVTTIFEQAGAHLQELSDTLWDKVAVRHGAMDRFINGEVVALTEVLEDWRRGIRDWSEVAEALDSVGIAFDELADEGDKEAAKVVNIA